MNEVQGKPANKWYKDKRGELFLICIFLIILLIIASVWIMYIGREIHYTKTYVYNTAKAELQNTIKAYQDKNNGALPTINGTVIINGSTYRIINICSLLNQSGEKRLTVLGCLWSGSGSNDDNCDGGCAECTASHSFIWTIDDEGKVYSTCVGKYCNASGVDGYQDAWP